MAKLMRLDKYLVEMNKGSRTQIKDAAKKGRIQVNGVPEKKTERKIDPETDEVTLTARRSATGLWNILCFTSRRALFPRQKTSVTRR